MPKFAAEPKRLGYAKWKSCGPDPLLGSAIRGVNAAYELRWAAMG
jgi:hypothetical protein